MLFDLKVTLRINIPVPSKMAASAALRQALLSSTVDFEYEIHEIEPVEGNVAEDQLELGVVEAVPALDEDDNLCSDCGLVTHADDERCRGCGELTDLGEMRAARDAAVQTEVVG